MPEPASLTLSYTQRRRLGDFEHEELTASATFKLDDGDDVECLIHSWGGRAATQVSRVLRQKDPVIAPFSRAFPHEVRPTLAERIEAKKAEVTENTTSEPAADAEKSVAPGTQLVTLSEEPQQGEPATIMPNGDPKADKRTRFTRKKALAELATVNDILDAKGEEAAKDLLVFLRSKFPDLEGLEEKEAEVSGIPLPKKITRQELMEAVVAATQRVKQPAVYALMATYGEGVTRAGMIPEEKWGEFIEKLAELKA